MSYHKSDITGNQLGSFFFGLLLLIHSDVVNLNLLLSSLGNYTNVTLYTIIQLFIWWTIYFSFFMLRHGVVRMSTLLVPARRSNTLIEYIVMWKYYTVCLSWISNVLKLH